MQALFESFSQLTVKEMMAQVHVPTILSKSREGVTLDTVLEPFVIEMIIWYKATEESGAEKNMLTCI